MGVEVFDPSHFQQWRRTFRQMIYGFYWLIEHEIAGMSLPNGIVAASHSGNGPISQECRDELRDLKIRGIGAIVSLTERSLNAALVRRHGFRFIHLPVPDMTPPTLQQILEFLRFVNSCKKERRAVVVHCLGGSGRTGTFLASYLVHKGHDAESAIRAVRICRPGAIETRGQEDFIERLETELKRIEK